MARFSQEVDVDIDVDVDEILAVMSEREKKEMFNELCKQFKHINYDLFRTDTNTILSLGEEEHIEICNKLGAAYHRMSNEECDLLKSLADRY